MDEESEIYRSCKKCRFFSPYLYNLDMDSDSDLLESDHGECRRFPPKVVSEDSCVFPIVNDSE